jgi:hypothetical protein
MLSVEVDGDAANQEVGGQFAKRQVGLRVVPVFQGAASTVPSGFGFARSARASALDAVAISQLAGHGRRLGVADDRTRPRGVRVGETVPDVIAAN